MAVEQFCPTFIIERRRDSASILTLSLTYVIGIRILTMASGVAYYISPYTFCNLELLKSSIRLFILQLSGARINKVNYVQTEDQ